jgi:hypothetical protein
VFSNPCEYMATRFRDYNRNCCAAERLITPWLPLIRSSHKRVPHVLVTFTTVGAELRSVSASVAELSGPFLSRHARLVEEFENPDVWPKHIVVEYLWEQLPDADPESGLVAVLTACVCLSSSWCSCCAAYPNYAEPFMESTVPSMKLLSACTLPLMLQTAPLSCLILLQRPFMEFTAVCFPLFE